MGLHFPHLSDELPRIEGQRHEGEPIGRVLPRQQDAQLGYAVQSGGGGFGLSAIGELIPSHASEREAGRSSEQPE